MGKTTLVLVLFAITIAAIAASPFLSPLAANVVPTSSDGDCSECHGSFVAFAAESRHPYEIPPGEMQTISITVSNTWKHEISTCYASVDLTEAPFLSFTDALEPVENIHHDGTSSRGSDATYTIDVSRTVVSVTITLAFDQRTVDLTDLDLSVHSPSGEVWAAQGSGGHSIELGPGDISRGGVGEYSLIVSHVRGLRSVPFTLDIVIEHGKGPVESLAAQDIGPGGSHTFEWSVIAEGEGSGTISFNVTSFVHHDHDVEEEDGKPVEDDATYHLEWELGSEVGSELRFSTQKIAASTGVDGWVLGRVFAFIAASSFILSTLLGGTIGPLRRGLDKMIGPGMRRKAHCTLAFIAISLVAVHVTALYTGLYSGTSKGLLEGGIALTGMALLALTGSFTRPISKRIGDRGWRILHLDLTIAVLVVLSIHAVIEGTEFAFLR
jgi:hypothetical protein